MKNYFSTGFYPVVFFIFFCMFFYNCEKSGESSDFLQNEDGTNIQESTQLSSGARGAHVLHNINLININNMQTSIDVSAHSKYLRDPLRFFDLPDGGVPQGRTAVVGSDVCLFYPVESISSDDELILLPEGEPVPFAAIIPLGEELKNSFAYKGWFSFQDNFNYFYKTLWNGKAGIVFGADLYGIGKSNSDNRINALLYKNNGYFENFYQYCGYDRIREDIAAELEKNGIAFQSVRPGEYSLSLERPDDMISLYMGLPDRSAASIFVTTDLAAHVNHLIFDRLLQYLEEEYFFPQLSALTDEYIKTIEQMRGQIPQEIFNASLLYFQTAQALLALAPDKIEEQGYLKTIEYRDKDAQRVLSSFPQQVRDEIQKMDTASGIGSSSIFSFMREDYSQYKARGHYTKNGVLSAYFRALMWYGRINFNLGGGGDTREYALRMAPLALFITDITEASPVIKHIWRSLFDPITELIGVSDDISFIELTPLWNRIKGNSFNQWYANPVNLERFITEEYSQMRPPSISGFSLLEGPHDGGYMIEDFKPPMGWRLFGQRYTLDSEIHHHLSPPRYFNPASPRHMVRGLDIMKVLGSATADWLLGESDYRIHAGLEQKMNELQRDLEKVSIDYWMSTYYNNVLYQIKTLSMFEGGTGFYFTEKPGWSLKAMNSAHGVWAELRHDTILYAKQVVAEMGGGSDDPTFRTKPLPAPIHYLEPNIPFWNASIIAFQKLYEILQKYGYLDGNTSQMLTRLHELYIKAAEISLVEAEDKPVSAADSVWISVIARELAYLSLTHTIRHGYVEDDNTLRMALAADVYTNAEIALVLETAVGIPYRLYIPLNDGQGGRRIAVGYGFSYYEFHQPMSNRLNNEQWKEIVYADNPDMSEYLPFWMQGRVLPP
ncbi:MAG: DUF3160 domain-containing protein [Treponema sp.]|jgi:hypothetical protein|nr:DUF3160 domain-containing protein [Treponema sp.]